MLDYSYRCQSIAAGASLAAGVSLVAGANLAAGASLAIDIIDIRNV